MSEAAKNLPNLPEFSVSELSAALKRTVEETFPFVRVRGEISGLKLATSGHIYFDLKDDKSVLNAIIWKQGARALPIRPEMGLEVVCTGRITTYPGSSRYQMIVEQMELAGAGALMAMLDERKKRLAAEGLFDAARKKKLPFLPEVIGVVTSPTGAVLRDIMHRLNARFPRRVLLWPVAVQGERAAGEVAAAIAGFNALPTAGDKGGGLPRPDLIIVARGGGSLEDLMAFNDEAVVRAAAASAIPLISAVGHETDTTLIDFASDMRAPTPTAAAELAVPVRSELLAQTLDFERRSLNCFTRGVEQRQRHLAQLARVLPRPEQLFAGPRQRLDGAGEKLATALRRNLQEHRAGFLEAAALLRHGLLQRRIGQLRERLNNLNARALNCERHNLGRWRQRIDAVSLKPDLLAIRVSQLREKLDNLSNRTLRCERHHLGKWRGQFEALTRMLESVSYRGVLERGFALVKGADGHVRRQAGALQPGEELTLVFADGEAAAMAGRGALPRTRGKKPGPDQGFLF